MLGPNKNGNFKPVVIKSIHDNRVNVPEATTMMLVCSEIRSTDPDKPLSVHDVRKGSFLINALPEVVKGQNPYQSISVEYFDVEIIVRKQCHTTIRTGFQCMVNIGNIRETA